MDGLDFYIYIKKNDNLSCRNKSKPKIVFFSDLKAKVACRFAYLTFVIDLVVVRVVHVVRVVVLVVVRVVFVVILIVFRVVFVVVLVVVRVVFVVVIVVVFFWRPCCLFCRPLSF